MRNTDLHNHSYYSDGQSSPGELIRIAKRKGIKNIALTDHSSVKGVKEAIKEGNRIGVNVIPAVEMQSNMGEILAYFVDTNNKHLKKELANARKCMQIAVKDRCKKFSKMGLPVTYLELRKRFPNANGNYNPFHILYLLYLKGYGKPMEIGENIQFLLETHNLKLAKFKESSAIKVIKTIRKSGGVPVLAHPWLWPDAMTHMKQFVKAGLKGIELNNGDRAPFRDPKWNKRIKNIARRYKLIITSGSDFHGPKVVKLMPGNHNLGKNSCDEKIIEALKKAKP